MDVKRSLVANAILAFFGLAVIIALVLFGPLLTIWGINTLILKHITGAALMSYGLFTWEWFAALLMGGTLAVFTQFKKKD